MPAGVDEVAGKGGDAVAVPAGVDAAGEVAGMVGAAVPAVPAFAVPALKTGGG